MRRESGAKDCPDGHIIISGPGRAGTTLLVQILTYLGCDTGFTRDECLHGIDQISRAGLEHSLGRDNLPKIIKSPGISEEIHVALMRGLKIQRAIIPLRRIDLAAESRRVVSAAASKLGLNPFKVHGGLWKVTNPLEQEGALAKQLYMLLDALTERDIPITFMSFPRFAYDMTYLHKKISPIIDNAITIERLVSVCGLLVDANKITIRENKNTVVCGARTRTIFGLLRRGAEPTA